MVWVAIRKTRRLKPIAKYWHFRPNEVWRTEDWVIWLGGFRRIIEVRRLRIKGSSEPPEGG